MKKMALALCLLSYLSLKPMSSGLSDLNRRFGASGYINNMPLYYKGPKEEIRHTGQLKKTKKVKKIKKHGTKKVATALDTKTAEKLAHEKQLEMRKTQTKLDLEKTKLKDELATAENKRIVKG